MDLTLVVLAAGMGSRYGGMKQLEKFGPGGATLMDYSVYDALRAGFGRLVFVIRPEMDGAFREAVGRRYERRVPVAYAYQRHDDLPLGFSVPADRKKPWGTGHAVLAAREVTQPFAVVNADDFYGAQGLAATADFLRGGGSDHALVGYRLRDTLPEEGAVSRGICQCTRDGWLESIVETLKIERCGADARCPDGHGGWRTLPGDTIVSMNLWAFTPGIFAELQTAFQRYLEQTGGRADTELHLPSAVQQALQAGRARVRVLPAGSVWCGVTNPQDKPRVERAIRAFVARGDYPAQLWD